MRGPTIVARPTPPTCTQETLDRAAPWAGRVVAREPAAMEGWRSRPVRREWVLCGSLDRDTCRAWAREAAERRAQSTDLDVEVVPGHSDRGKLWVVDAGDGEEAHLFATNRDFVAFFEGLDEAGKEPVVVGSDRVIEARYNRVEITYRTKPVDATLPASIWIVEVDDDPQSLVEASLAFEDLELSGIDLTYESWSELHRATRDAAGQDAGYPQLVARSKRQESRGKLRLSIDVTCRRD